VSPAPIVTSYAPLTGYSGFNEVDVIGTGLGCRGTARFDVSSAPVLSWSPTEVRVRASTGLPPGTATLTLTSFGGTVVTVGPFTILPAPPAPTITSFTPTSGSDGTVAAGSTTGPIQIGSAGRSVSSSVNFTVTLAP
jgi:hypothetical protein